MLAFVDSEVTTDRLITSLEAHHAADRMTAQILMAWAEEARR